MNHEDILNHTHSRQELIARGESDSTIRTQVRRGEIVKMREGVYASPHMLKYLSPWQKPIAQSFTYHKRSPGTIFSHTSAALLLGLGPVTPLPEVRTLTLSNARGRASGVKKASCAVLGGVFNPLGSWVCSCHCTFGNYPFLCAALADVRSSCGC